MTTVLTFSQSLVTGKVLDESGQPLVGVTIIQKNTMLGTITDGIGRFNYTAIETGAQTLVFSYLGYQTLEYDLDDAKDLVITMKLSSIMTSEVVVAAVRARKDAPLAVAEMTGEQLKEVNFGQDLPSMLDQLPSVVTSSDAGAGVGYSSFRIRGTDITRINVTVNGIPLNDAESQGVYWVNMPDFAASTDKLQMQRGVGTSTNGASSFGGSINLSTLDAPTTSSVLVDNSYGSFSTWKNSVALSSGLLDNNLAFDVRLSQIKSDGFVDRGASDLKSYYLSGGWYGKKSVFKFITFAGFEKTYQAWNGVPKVKLDNDTTGMRTLVNHEDWSAEETANLFASDARTYNRYLYANQTDNYKQDHYQLHFTHTFNKNLNITSALHYTKGKGYYESYKYNTKFSKYNVGFDEVVIDGASVKKTDMILQKWLDNDFYGATFSANYSLKGLIVNLGGAYNQYEGDHYGNIVWAAVNNGITDNFEWYSSTGQKNDLNGFLKASYDVTRALSLFGDLQYRYVDFGMEGTHDDLSDLTQRYNYGFFNPKGGVNFAITPNQRVFASVAKAQREPSRSNFRDADLGQKPTPETLVDYEVGYEVQTSRAKLNINGFYMAYEDQLVQTGEINNVGEPIMVNVPSSYRTGVEVAAAFVITSRINWVGNATFSMNKIKDFTSYVDNWSFDAKKKEDHDKLNIGLPEVEDPDMQKQFVSDLGKTDLAFSPNITAASRFNYLAVKGLTVSLLSKYVGEQYIDNTSNKDRMLSAWLVNDLMINYDFKVDKVGAFNLGLKVNNLLNEQYITNAWVYQYYLNDANNTPQHHVMDGYFVQAGTNFMVRVGMTF